MSRTNLSSGSTQRGIVLVEAMVAILLFSIGVLAVVGLQASMVKNTSDSKFRADASYIAQQRLGQMWADPVNVLTYLEDPATDISDMLPKGTRKVVQRPDGSFEIIVTWQQPGETVEHNFTVVAGVWAP